MRTITVKEAAAALGITPRAVSYRLEKGQLKGTLSKNEATGVPEWRIYPNKEILSGLSQTRTGDTTEIDFEPNDVIEAETVDDTARNYTTKQSAAPLGAMDFQLIVEQCVRPLVEEVKAQTLALAEKDRIIEEQNRQLRLLPDFQKTAEDEKSRAEEERQAAQLKAMEAEALRKQITAMEAGQQQAEEARRNAEEEIERLKEEKEAQVKAVQEQLQALSATVQELKNPWWKKWFSAGHAP